jgi:rhomboid protease GluP
MIDQTPQQPGAYPVPPELRRDPTIKVDVPLVTYVLLGLTILIYAFQFGTETLLGTDIPAVLGMKINEAIMAGEYWRFLTPMFLHGSILHIGFNMYALIVIGSGLEQRMGHGRFLLLYTLGAFAGNVFSFLFSASPSLGASTAIFGLLGAEGVFLYQNRDLFGGQARRALQNVIGVAAFNLLLGLSPGIDNWGHVGGLLGGLAFSWFGGPKFGVEETAMFPFRRVVDVHDTGGVITGALLVIGVFGALAAWGLGWF